MRLHTNIIDYTQKIRTVLDLEKQAGRIAPSVYLRRVDPHQSRSHQFAYEISLSSTDQVKGDGRRRGNDGAYGAMTDEYAATYDEWGWLIAAIYKLDSAAVFGSAKHPVYASFEDYAHRTGYTYFPEQLIRMIDEHGDPYPYVGKGARAGVGRRGSGRVDGDTMANGYRISASQLESWYSYKPRTAEWVAEFAHLVPEHV